MLWHTSPFLSLFGLAEAEQSPHEWAKRNKTDMFRGTSVQCTPQNISLMMPAGIRFSSRTISVLRQQAQFSSPSGSGQLCVTFRRDILTHWKRMQQQQNAQIVSSQSAGSFLHPIQSGLHCFAHLRIDCANFGQISFIFCSTASDLEYGKLKV